MWDPTEAAFQEGLRHMRAVPPTAEGLRFVTQTHVSDDGYKLGTWQDMQRQNFRKGKLSALRLAELERIGFVWDMHEAMWEEGYAQFVAFPVDDEGKRAVPQSYKAQSSGFRLGMWQDKQRTAFRRGELTAERAARLDAAGFVWDPHQISWDEGFRHLKEYPADSKGRRAPQRLYVSPDGFKLGYWVDNQRQARRRGWLLDSR